MNKDKQLNIRKELMKLETVPRNKLSPSDRRRLLRHQMNQQELVVAPSSFNALSASLIEAVGFSAVHVSGSSVSRSAGYSDINLLGMSEVVAVHEQIVESTSVPVIGDAEAGFGSPVHVARTVRAFERAGVSAIHIEDEFAPKAPGTAIGSHVAIPVNSMVEKLKAALDSRIDSTFILIARSNARDCESFAQVIDRLSAYAETGVDAIWPGVFEKEDCDQLKHYVKLPMVGSPHRAPSLKAFAGYGFKVAVIPAVIGQVVSAAMAEFLEIFKRTGSGEEYWKRHPDMERWRQWFNNLGREKEQSILLASGASKLD